MLHEYSSYELKILKKIADYRNIFSADQNVSTSQKKAHKQPEKILANEIAEFTELFCSHNFADTDYSIIQQDQYIFISPDAWINSVTLETVLQCITYVIWTDRSIKGYFIKKINDHFLEKILTRLNAILEEFEKTKAV